MPAADGSSRGHLLATHCQVRSRAMRSVASARCAPRNCANTTGRIEDDLVVTGWVTGWSSRLVDKGFGFGL
jgi:hypothetical protein